MAAKSPLPPRMAFGKNELKIIQELFRFYRSQKMDLGYQGRYEKLYTEAFVQYMGGEGYADAVCTGTAGIFVALASLQLPEGSEVLISPVTDPGTVSAVILNRLTPVIADAAPNSFNIGINEFKAAISTKTRAVIVVHLGGKAAEIGPITQAAKEKNIRVIEDCSQAHGAKFQDQKVGAFGDVAVFSTMYRKAHATGGSGGVIYTQNVDLYHLIRSYADRGKPFFKPDFNEKNPGSFLFPALNFNSDEISCAIGIKSLQKLDQTIQKRLAFLFELKKALEKESRVCWMEVSDQDSPFFQTICLDTGKLSCSKLQFAQALLDEGVSINPNYLYVVSDWPWVKPYLGRENDCPNATGFRETSFNLLFNENFGGKEVAFITKAIRRVEERYVK